MASADEIEVKVANEKTDIEVLTDRDMLYQLLFNLGSNAVDAIKEKCKSDPDFSCNERDRNFFNGRRGQAGTYFDFRQRRRDTRGDSRESI